MALLPEDHTWSEVRNLGNWKPGVGCLVELGASKVLLTVSGDQTGAVGIYFAYLPFAAGFGHVGGSYGFGVKGVHFLHLSFCQGAFPDLGTVEVGVPNFLMAYSAKPCPVSIVFLLVLVSFKFLCVFWFHLQHWLRDFPGYIFQNCSQCFCFGRYSYF